MKYLLACLILTITLALVVGKIYLPENHVSVQALFLTQGIIVSAGLLKYRSLLLIMLVILLVAAINLPPSLLEIYRIDRSLLIVSLVGIIVAPLIARRCGFK